jgi:hypothetical protein
VAETVYILCALTGLVCTGLLARAYRRARSRLLLWAAVCFACLTINSVLVVIDLIVLPTQVDLRLSRQLAAIVGLLLMLWALITEAD